MSELILTVDLGRFRAFNVIHELGEREHLAEIASSELPSKPGTWSDHVTDMAGRFPKGGTPDAATGMSYGEATQAQQEEERRSIEAVAERIAGLLETAGVTKWHLAAPATINRRLVDALPPAATRSLGANLAVDLTKHSLKDIEARFADRNRAH